MNSIGCTLYQLGDLAGSNTYFQAFLRLSDEIGDLRLVSIALRNLGRNALDIGDYNIAHEHFTESLRVARAAGVTTAERAIPFDLGTVAQAIGDYDAALAAYQESLRQIKAVDDPLLEGSVLCEIARLLWKRGEYAMARTHVQRALAIAQSIGHLVREALALTTLGHIELAVGRTMEAQNAYAIALEKLRAIDQIAYVLEAQEGLARVLLATGDVIGTLQHVNTMLAGLETGTLTTTNEPFLVYLTCYNVLVAANDPRIISVLEEAYARLQHVHQLLRDEAWRRMFLQNVPVNRALVAAWRALHPQVENMAE